MSMPKFLSLDVWFDLMMILMSSYKDRFLASLPASRRTSVDFTRPVFTAVAFYLCAKTHKVPTDLSLNMYMYYPFFVYMSQCICH